jgi:hypothetical protein
LAVRFLGFPAAQATSFKSAVVNELERMAWFLRSSTRAFPPQESHTLEQQNNFLHSIGKLEA